MLNYSVAELRIKRKCVHLLAEYNKHNYENGFSTGRLTY